MTRSEKKHNMFSLIKEWKSSSEGIELFCKRHELSTHIFYYWRKIYEASKSPLINDSFLPIKVSPPKSPSSSLSISLTYPNGVKLSIPSDTDITLVRDLITIY